MRVLGDFNEDIMLNNVCNVKSMFSSHNFVQHIDKLREIVVH